MRRLRVERHTGDRSEIRKLFEEAEDSPSQLDGYIDAGIVLVAVIGDQVVGHLQLVDDGIQLRDRVWLDRVP